MRATQIASMLRELYTAGWTIDMIYNAGGPAPAQQWRITRSLVDRCYGKTVRSVTDLHASLQFGREWVSPEPFVSLFLARHRNEVASIMDDADRRMFYRLLEEDGQQLNVFVADRWCDQYLGLHLYEVYPVTSAHWRHSEESSRSAA